MNGISLAGLAAVGGWVLLIVALAGLSLWVRRKRRGRRREDKLGTQPQGPAS